MNNFTKYTFTIILVWLSFNAFAQSNKFVIQTNFVKKIKVIDKAANTNYLVPEFRQSSGGYLISCKDPKMTYLSPTNDMDTVKVKVLWLDKEISSEWVVIDGSLSLEDIVEKHQSNIIWEQIKNSWSSITSFFTFARNGLVEQERGAFLKSTDEGLYFTQPDSLEIARIEDLAIDWKTSEKINRIELVNPETEQVIAFEKNYQLHYFDYHVLNKKTQKKIKKGYFYQLRIATKDTASNTNYYRYNFYLYNKKELKQLNKFLSK